MPAVVTEEFSGFPTFSGSPTERGAVRKVKIAWSDIGAFINELYPPFSFPAELPGSPGLFADTFNIVPELEGDTKILGTGVPNVYANAIVTINYKTIPFAPSEGDESGSGSESGSEGEAIITRKFSISGEVMSLPNTGLEWENNGGPNNDKNVNAQVVAGKVIPLIEHHLTLHQVENLDLDEIRDLIGKLNAGTFEGAPAETLLFSGAEGSQVISANTTKPWEVDLVLLERRLKQGGQNVGWNHFFRPETGAWEVLKAKVTGDKIYATGNFGPLKDL